MSHSLYFGSTSPPGTVAIMVQRNSRLKLLFHMYKSEESHWPAKNGVDNRGNLFQQQLHLIYLNIAFFCLCACMMTPVVSEVGL